MNQQPIAESSKGLLIVHTGNGKGKTSAALNLVYRHLAHGKQVSVVQFIKQPDDYDYGDKKMLEQLAATGAPVSITMLGTGFSWNRAALSKARHAAEEAWAVAAAAIADPKIDLVVCDELHIALSQGHLELDRVLQSIRARPESSHVVTTGRRAPAALIDAADLVTDFVEIKHPYKAGISAQAGIEY